VEKKREGGSTKKGKGTGKSDDHGKQNHCGESSKLQDQTPEKKIRRPGEERGGRREKRAKGMKKKKKTDPFCPREKARQGFVLLKVKEGRKRKRSKGW